MSDQPQEMSDLEPKLRSVASARPVRTDTDGNTSGNPGITLGSADCRALLHEIEKLLALTVHSRSGGDSRAFGGREVAEGCANGVAQGVRGSGGGGAEQALELAEGEFDRVQVGAIWGKVEQRRPRASIASRTPATLWLPRLSATTVSPGRSVGASICSTQARKAGPWIAPSSTSGATSPSARRPRRKVVVHQCQCGTGPTRRSPRGARPHGRVRAVVAQVSSRNTSLAEFELRRGRVPGAARLGHVGAVLLGGAQPFF